MKSNDTDQLFRGFMERYAKTNGCDLPAAAQLLVNHPWREVQERMAFYPKLAELLRSPPLDIQALRACIDEHGQILLGGHAAFRMKVREFLDDQRARGLIELLVAGPTGPDAATIERFVSDASTYGFRGRSGAGGGAAATYFASILLTATFPANFVDCRLTRWDWMSEQFHLTPYSNQQYGDRLVTAGRMARDLVTTRTFQSLFPAETPLWTAGGLAFLFHREPTIRSLVEDCQGEQQWTFSVDASVRNAFAEFRRHPVAIFTVRMRRKRAEQLRELLRDPDDIDLAAFNQGVWVFATSAIMHGESVVDQLAATAELSEDRICQLEAGLQSGELELRGNFMWGTASRVFAPMLPGADEDKLAHVRKALRILNDEEMEPLAKARQMIEVPGFGSNSATGLVMVFHPQEFAIWNGPSASAVDKLGFVANDLPTFEKIITKLRTVLGAEDFLELDHFLYLLDQGHLKFVAKTPAWWVCQGMTYASEFSGGYIFAPKETSNGRVVRHHADVATVRPGQELLHYADGAIRATGTAKGTARSAARPDEMAGEQPGRPGYLVQVTYQQLKQPITLDEIPASWRTAGEKPFNSGGKVKQGYLYPISHDFLSRIKERFADRFPPTKRVVIADYAEPSFESIRNAIADHGLRISARMLRRYHLSLKTRGFVVLCGLSGSGKTWLAELYARAVGAEHLLVPVAPNWTTNEDLLGYLNPMDGAYHDTPFSLFLRKAAGHFKEAAAGGVTARPFHLILDEMNLARVEYYFARFLSCMEQRARGSEVAVELSGTEHVLLPPNLYFIGTVNVDETTHGFADKVYDRAQLVEMFVDSHAIRDHLGGVPYAEALMGVWETIKDVGPFAFRVVDEIKSYVDAAAKVGVPWQEALDEQLLQKVLPKVKGAERRVEEALEKFVALTADQFPMSSAKAARMLEMLRHHGLTSYF